MAADHHGGARRQGAPARPVAARPRARSRCDHRLRPAQRRRRGPLAARLPGGRLLVDLAEPPALAARAQGGRGPRRCQRDGRPQELRGPRGRARRDGDRRSARWWSVAPSMASCATRTSSTASPRRHPRTGASASRSWYSSGTTGKPKAIVRPKVAEIDPWDYADQASIFCRAFQFVPFDGAHLVSAGMHHGGCQSYYMGALNVAQPLVIMAKFDAERALAADRGPQGHDHLHGPHAVRAAAQAPRRGASPLRRLEPEGRGALGRPVPGRGEAGDDGLVGPRHLGDLRRHGGRSHDRQAPSLAGQAGHGGSSGQGDANQDPRRRGLELPPARSARSTSSRPTRPSSTTTTPSSTPSVARGRPSPWERSGTSTRTATCSCAIGRRT